MERPISIAIETSCRRGGVALGAGEELVEAAGFQAQQRHAVQLVARLAELLSRHGLRAADLEEMYVSIGPGSFTGLRVGLSVARTLAQLVSRLRCVGVPTADAVAQNAAGLAFENLGVVMDAREGTVYAATFRRDQGAIVPAGTPRVLPPEQFAAQAPRPIILIGEGLAYCRIAGDGITLGDESLWLPSPEGLWRVGRRMARKGEFEDFHKLRPLYLRKPEAVRLWEKRRGEPREN
jgi:tRNA threonylcarbamoyladenosine biosynthesis protein TsaB